MYILKRADKSMPDYISGLPHSRSFEGNVVEAIREVRKWFAHTHSTWASVETKSNCLYLIGAFTGEHFYVKVKGIERLDAKLERKNKRKAKKS